jgi:hypothetical protein
MTIVSDVAPHLPHADGDIRTYRPSSPWVIVGDDENEKERTLVTRDESGTVRDTVLATNGTGETGPWVAERPHRLGSDDVWISGGSG